jgi:hypothetical protein
VEVFQPGSSAPAFPPQLIRDALLTIDGASPPLSPVKNAKQRYAAPVIAQAIAAHRGGRASETEGNAVLDHLVKAGLVYVDDVNPPRRQRVRLAQGVGVDCDRQGGGRPNSQPGRAYQSIPATPAISRNIIAGRCGRGAPRLPRNARGVWGECGGSGCTSSRHRRRRSKRRSIFRSR